MRVVVAAAVGLLAMLGARPSWGDHVEPVRLPDGSDSYYEPNPSIPDP